MSNSPIIEAFEARVLRRQARREFLANSARIGVAAVGVSMIAACGNDDDPTGRDESGSIPPVPPPPAAAPLGDADILNFALNAEYLESNFYLFATTGAGLAGTLATGQGVQGAATGGRQVAFADPEVRRLALEIAADERAHVTFLRTQLGTAAIAQPTIDLGTAPTGAFSSAARAAGLIGAGASFDPYASDDNFLLASFLLADVGVTAYKGSATSIQSATILEQAAGILATEAYHAGAIRTTLYGRGVQTPSLRTATEQISNARDSLDGTSDIDQGVINGVPVDTTASNITPADANAIAFGRTPQQVLNILYLNRAAVTVGGFFPNGVNGRIQASAAN